MNNKELAAKCLIEAAELLTEGIFGGKKDDNSAQKKIVKDRIAEMNKRLSALRSKHSSLKSLHYDDQAQEVYEQMNDLERQIKEEQNKLNNM